MKTAWIAAGAAALVAAVCAETTPLWPEGKIPDFQPNQIAAPSQDVGQKGFDRAAHRMPYLDWSPKPANPNGACVILISGGGYGCTCDGPAFKPLEKAMLDAGITCVWLWYRTPRPEGLPIYQSGWEDGQRAVRIGGEARVRPRAHRRLGLLGGLAPLRDARHLRAHARVQARGRARRDAVPRQLGHPDVPGLRGHGRPDGQEHDGRQRTRREAQPVVQVRREDLPDVPLPRRHRPLFAYRLHADLPPAPPHEDPRRAPPRRRPRARPREGARVRARDRVHAPDGLPRTDRGARAAHDPRVGPLHGEARDGGAVACGQDAESPARNTRPRSSGTSRPSSRPRRSR